MHCTNRATQSNQSDHTALTMIFVHAVAHFRPSGTSGNGASPSASQRPVGDELSNEAADALKGVENMMQTICKMANLSMSDLEQAAPGRRQPVRVQARDPAKGALSSLEKMAGAIVQLSSSQRR
jgi:hypothetical protein